MRVIGISVTTQPSTLATTAAAERPGKERPWRRSVNGTALRSTSAAANAASAAGNHGLTVVAHCNRVARPAPNTSTIGAVGNQLRGQQAKSRASETDQAGRKQQQER